MTSVDIADVAPIIAHQPATSHGVCSPEQGSASTSAFTEAGGNLEPPGQQHAAQTIVGDSFGDPPPGVDPTVWQSLDAEDAAAIQAAMFAGDSDDDVPAAQADGGLQGDDGAHGSRAVHAVAWWNACNMDRPAMPCN